MASDLLVSIMNMQSERTVHFINSLDDYECVYGLLSALRKFGIGRNIDIIATSTAGHDTYNLFTWRMTDNAF